MKKLFVFAVIGLLYLLGCGDSFNGDPKVTTATHLNVKVVLSFDQDRTLTLQFCNSTAKYLHVDCKKT